MDIYQYINSRNIGNYLREIKYNFSIEEAAWIVWHNWELSISQKHRLYEQIMEEFCDNNASEFHKVLKEYIRLEEKLLSWFLKEKSDYFYSISIDYTDDGNLYSTYEAALESLKEYIDEDTDLRIILKRVNRDNPCARVIINASGEILDIDSISNEDIALTDNESGLYLTFDNMWFDFPHPFKKGDIICVRGQEKIKDFCKGPFVVIGAGTDGRKSVYKGCDTTDMNAWGYWTNEDGSIYYEVMDNYMDCEFYRGKLNGTNKMLKPLSEYLKGNIGEDLLINASIRHFLNNQSQSSLNWYTDEGLALVGLDPKRGKIVL